jgi:tRNA dimethylallyltransferase
LHLAEAFQGEILNCDSMQLYRGFDIGTAKPALDARKRIPHHLFDVLEPTAVYSAGDYARAARAKVMEITQRGKVPIAAGGTGFYLRALLDGLPSLPGRDEFLRKRLAAREGRSPGSLHRLLARLEPAAAARIHSRDAQKLIRALEVRILTKSALPAPQSAEPLSGYRALQIGLSPDRALLHVRLEQRARAMFAGGLLDEVRGLLGAGCTGMEKPFESLGYKQALQYIRGEITLETAIESTIVETRQYAKRQWTWFRRDARVVWLDGFGSDPKVISEATGLVGRFLDLYRGC